MKGNSIYEISYKHLKEKRNIIFSIIIVLLIIVLYITSTIINFALQYQNNINKKSLNARTLIVERGSKTDEELNQISNINHVVLNVSDKYRAQFPVSAEEFDEKDIKGNIVFNPLLINNGIKIIANIITMDFLLITDSLYNLHHININKANFLHYPIKFLLFPCLISPLLINMMVIILKIFQNLCKFL